MEARRRTAPEKEKVVAVGEGKPGKLAKKPEQKREEYDFSVLKSLFDENN